MDEGMHWIIDLLLVFILVYCAWRGYRNGIIVGVCGFAAILVAVVLGNILATTYAEDLSGVLEPFASGVVDSAMSEVLNGTVDEEGNVVELIDPSLRGDTAAVARAVLNRLGMAENTAASLGDSAAEYVEAVGPQLSERLSQALCIRLSYVVIFMVAFLLVLIVFTVVGNVIDLRFSLPGIELVDRIAGAAIGLLRGFAMVVFLALLLRYAGVLLPEGTVEKTILARNLVEHNILANLLGL